MDEFMKELMFDAQSASKGDTSASIPQGSEPQINQRSEFTASTSTPTNYQASSIEQNALNTLNGKQQHVELPILSGLPLGGPLRHRSNSDIPMPTFLHENTRQNSWNSINSQVFNPQPLNNVSSHIEHSDHSHGNSSTSNGLHSNLTNFLDQTYNPSPVNTPMLQHQFAPVLPSPLQQDIFGRSRSSSTPQYYGSPMNSNTLQNINSPSAVLNSTPPSTPAFYNQSPLLQSNRSTPYLAAASQIFSNPSSMNITPSPESLTQNAMPSALTSSRQLLPLYDPTATSSEFRIVPPTKTSSTLVSKRAKQVREGISHCGGCSAPVALLRLHGTDAQFNHDPFTVDVRCLPCISAMAAREEEHPNGLDKVWLKCDACKGQVGKGGVRVLLRSPKSEPAHSVRYEAYQKPADRRNSQGAGTKEIGWIYPDFGVEVICNHCTQNYRLCSDCGSGCKWRTGKWRPKEYFNNRKTCDLDHIRGESKPVAAVVYRIPCGLNQDDVLSWNLKPTVAFSNMDIPIPYTHLRGIEVLKKMTLDTQIMILNQLAEYLTAATIRSGSHIHGTSLQEQWFSLGELSLQNVQTFLTGECIVDKIPDSLTSVKQYRRYASFNFGPLKLPTSNSRKARQERPMLGSPFVIQSRAVLEFAGFDTSHLPPLTTLGISCAQWFVTDRHVMVSSVFDSTRTLVKHIRAAIAQDIKEDQSLPKPIHLWMYAGIGDVSLHSEGFLPLVDYAAAYNENVDELKATLQDHVEWKNNLTYHAGKMDIFVKRWIWKEDGQD